MTVEEQMHMMSVLSSYVAIQLNFEQNIETSSKILSITGYNKRLPERKIGDKIAKQAYLYLWYCAKYSES